MGRRGTPRKLDVPGEELPKVAYRLTDAASYRGVDVLVVGGGDSAVEAALALSAQPRNRVTVSYRQETFFRLKARNEQRIQQAVRAGKVTVMFRSQVRSILPHQVALGTEAGETSLANDFVFVFAGGVPPFQPLKEAGVQFGRELKREPSPERR
ncbi:MAG: NAD(P)-binding domain-containing protein [Planctomycetota bacterium]